MHKFAVTLKGDEGTARGKVVVPCGRLSLTGEFVKFQRGLSEVTRKLDEREVVVESGVETGVTWGRGIDR